MEKLEPCKEKLGVKVILLVIGKAKYKAIFFLLVDGYSNGFAKFLL